MHWGQKNIFETVISISFPVSYYNYDNYDNSLTCFFFWVFWILKETTIIVRIFFSAIMIIIDIVLIIGI